MQYYDTNFYICDSRENRKATHQSSRVTWFVPERVQLCTAVYIDCVQTVYVATATVYVATTAAVVCRPVQLLKHRYRTAVLSTVVLELCGTAVQLLTAVLQQLPLDPARYTVPMTGKK